MSQPPNLAPPIGAPSSESPPAGTAPPGYAPSQPQILIAPLPDSPSFFWGRTVQGEIFVKGLGASDGQTPSVQSLTVSLTLNDHYPHRPTLPIHSFDPQTLYPATAASSSSNTTFPSIHRFNIPLPQHEPLPGTLNLVHHNRGEVKWGLTVTLTLAGGTAVTESVPVDGTPQDVYSEEVTEEGRRPAEEVEEVLERDGVRARMLLDQTRPRHGKLLRLGVEVQPGPRQKTGVAGLSSQPDGADTLRSLRRVRVEMFRRVRVTEQHSSASTSKATASGTSGVEEEGHQHLSLVYTSGKVLRYPGSPRSHPPLRVLFTLPTAQLGSVADMTWGEITQSTPYHRVTFFVRATLGFGGMDSSPTTDGQPWVLEREIELRPKVWKEPRQVVISRGIAPALGQGEEEGGMSDEEMRQAYRLKGMDVVGHSGTYRMDAGTSSDLPPPFDGPGPSHVTPPEGGGLPTFLESEAQMETGEAPLPPDAIPSERLVPVAFSDDDERTTTVGRRGSLGGELGTWVEFDGYETFSVAPPDVAASFGAAGVMDPPQEGDEDVNLVGGMIGRLGLEGNPTGQSGRELIESLGLGAGSRVVDLHDDLPPGIDEPSLPALPDFRPTYHPTPPPMSDGIDPPPPSFAASEAAVAQRRASMSTHSHHHTSSHPTPIDLAPMTHTVQARGHVQIGSAPMSHHGSTGAEQGDAPPGYFGGGAGQPAGPPAYS